MTVAAAIDLPAQLLTGGRVVTPDGVLTDAWVHVVGDTIVSIQTSKPAVDAPVVDLGGAWLLPGYVDLHMHGGGGYSVASSIGAMDEAVAFHRVRGTTSTLVSLMTASVAELTEQLGWAAELARRGPMARGSVLGSHLEGPFLSSRRSGAQNAAHMIAPDSFVLHQLLAASEGTLRMITLAPEIDGALSLIAPLRHAGVIVAMGHSDANYEQAAAAIRAGANHATHLFNAMPPLHHREPGLIGAVLEAGISCELINDGRHVHHAVVRLVCSLIACPVLVTDAIDATGVGDGTFDLGGQEVHVHDGGSTGEHRIAGGEHVDDGPSAAPRGQGQRPQRRAGGGGGVDQPGAGPRAGRIDRFNRRRPARRPGGPRRRPPGDPRHGRRSVVCPALTRHSPILV